MMYTIQGNGVRSCRLCLARAELRERTRDGRLQVRIEVATDRISCDRWTRPQWADAALVFIDEAEARDLYRRARKLADRTTIVETAVSLTAGSEAR